MAPIEGTIGKREIRVPAGRRQRTSDFGAEVTIIVEGREEGGAVRIENNSGFAVDLKSTGKPLISLQDNATDIYLKARQSVEIIGLNKEINLKGIK